MLLLSSSPQKNGANTSLNRFITFSKLLLQLPPFLSHSVQEKRARGHIGHIDYLQRTQPTETILCNLQSRGGKRAIPPKRHTCTQLTKKTHVVHVAIFRRYLLKGLGFWIFFDVCLPLCKRQKKSFWKCLMIFLGRHGGSRATNASSHFNNTQTITDNDILKPVYLLWKESSFSSWTPLNTTNWY